METAREAATIDAVLDVFHAAAAAAGEQRYFAVLAPTLCFWSGAG